MWSTDVADSQYSLAAGTKAHPSRPGHKHDPRRRGGGRPRSGFLCVGCGAAIPNTDVATAVHLTLDSPRHRALSVGPRCGWVCTHCCGGSSAHGGRTHLNHGFWTPHESVDPALPCEGCSQPVRLRSHHRRTRVLCSNACRVRTNPAHRTRIADTSLSRCRQCAAAMAGTRSSRQYCSSACRQRAYRIRTAIDALHQPR